MTDPNDMAHVAAAAGRVLTQSELDAIFAAVQRRAAEYVKGGMSQADAIAQAGASLAAEHRAERAKARYAALEAMQQHVAITKTVRAIEEGCQAAAAPHRK